MKRDSACLDAPARSENSRSDRSSSNGLRDVVRDFQELVQRYETGLLRSLEPSASAGQQSEPHSQRDRVRRDAFRLASSDLSASYSRKQIHDALAAAETQGKTAEERLHAGAPETLDEDPTLANIRNGHFRLYSTQLFELLGQPTDLRFGSLRFHTEDRGGVPHEDGAPPPSTTVEIALNSSFFVGESDSTQAYHSFSIPTAPSPTNRGILCRKPDAYPEYDSWVLFTFLGSGCLKVEVPIEMCADVYGGDLRGRDNEEVVFWGLFVEDA